MQNITKSRFAAMIFLWVTLFVMSPRLFAQGLNNLSVEIDAEQASQYTIIKSLEKQTGYFFTFDSRLTDHQKKFSIKENNISIQQAIDTIFPGLDLTYRIINNNIVIIPSSGIYELEKRFQKEIDLNIIEVTGTVMDENSGDPLPYSSLALINTNMGTIANDDGTFLLRIPDTINQPIIVTSYMGYKNQYTPVSLARDKPLNIHMNKNMISLQEVIIRYKNPYKLLSEVVRNIPNNYIDKPSGMRAYYREKVMRDDKCMVFSEAVLDIAKASYTNSNKIERTKILKGRKVTNIQLQDTVVLKIRSGVNTMLQLDIINHPPDFLTPNFYTDYELTFVDMISYNDRLVNVISFKPKEHVEETLFNGELYIDQETYAIVAADFKYDPKRIKREQAMFVQKKSRNIKMRPTSTMYHVEYTLNGDRYYLNQVKGEVKFKVRKKKQWIASKYKINLEMAVT
ncbi:MAG TPA: carboxypeptidase-like regulatory domain-containing protein, partial [Bacteroidales bacterium]|nr:carboxypeptidase-like regulatory domain-containing protein [Bacteroidales bacterium]